MILKLTQKNNPKSLTLCAKVFHCLREKSNPTLAVQWRAVDTCRKVLETIAW